MGKIDLQCIFIGQKSKIYSNLLESLNGFELRLNVRLVSARKKQVIQTLKSLKGAGIVFIFDTVPFSIKLLSDLIWQYSPDATVVIVTEKKSSTFFNKPFNNTQISRLHYERGSADTHLFLQYLLQSAQLRTEFRQCKKLLGISEKRCLWLVDSSHEAVAFISRDLHLYANTRYLALFGIDSVLDLHAVAVQDVVEKDEYKLFDSFIKSQLKRHQISRSLIVTMRKRNGATFRAKIIVIPSVYKGQKCLQLWVHAFSQEWQENLTDNKLPMGLKKTASSDENEKKLINPFELLSKEKSMKQKTPDPAVFLQGIIKRKEASISAQKLYEMKKNEGSYNELYSGYYLLSLVVPVAQRKGIDNLLFKTVTVDSEDQRVIFWDKVKLTRLLQILLKKKRLTLNLFVRINESSVSSRTFARWFLPGLNRLGTKSSNLTFLISAQLNERQRKCSLDFVKELKRHHCKIALDHFSTSPESLRMLKHVKPDYVRLSLPWVKKIEGNDSREIALASLIRQLEVKNIRVIAPCGFSRDMRKLFILSGASFCQERTIKTR